MYPFKDTIEKPGCTRELCIENIDIGGPSMIRSAAKNHQSVGVIVNPSHYNQCASELKQNNGTLNLKTKQILACEAFHHTAAYDQMIAQYLSTSYHYDADSLTIQGSEKQTLRYGENPHQEAAFFSLSNSHGLGSIIQHHGKELSYNNIVDLEAAWLIVKEFQEPCITIIKHTNPCGTATAETLKLAYAQALAADPVSAFGSIIGSNMVINAETAEEMSSLFIEAIIAPGFDKDALEILTKKPSIRLIELPNMYAECEPFYKHVQGGLLIQSANSLVLNKETLKTVTKTASTSETKDLETAFKVCKHVKSNAIVLVKDGQTVGVGAGQMSRIEALEIAIKKAGSKAHGSVLASDAFFPFKDCVETAAQAGISAIIQPGGSKRDQESIDACDEHSISMLFTGIRHFKH